MKDKQYTGDPACRSSYRRILGGVVVSAGANVEILFSKSKCEGKFWKVSTPSGWYYSVVSSKGPLKAPLGIQGRGCRSEDRLTVRQLGRKETDRHVVCECAHKLSI